MTMEKKLRLCKLAFAVLIVNFILFCVGATVIGGSFAFEKSGNGHYFVSEHGTYREVSLSIFIYSIIHACSVVVTHVTGIYAGRFYNKHKPPE